MVIEETIIFLASYSIAVTLEHTRISPQEYSSVGRDIMICKGRGSNSTFSTYSPRVVNL
jgi:hypothetical protein